MLHMVETLLRLFDDSQGEALSEKILAKRE